MVISLVTAIVLPSAHSCVSAHIFPTIHPPRLPRSLELVQESTFKQDVLQWLGAEGVSFRCADIDLDIPGDTSGAIFSLSLDRNGSPQGDRGRGTKGIAVHLLPSPRSPSEVRCPASNRRLTDAFQAAFGSNMTIIHLHEDVWRTKEAIVKARILARLGRLRSRHFARKTIARRIGRDLYIPFLEDHHLWGATRAKFGYGLFDKSNDELLAVATFSSRRHVIRSGRKHRSHELIRTCSMRDGHVVGGISKLIRSFVRDHSPDDLVTVVDRDWGPGSSAWHGLGFETVYVMPPLPMAIGKGNGLRRHVVGAGIVPTASNETLLSKGDSGRPLHRPGLPIELLEKLKFGNKHDNEMDGVLAPSGILEESAAAECILAQYGFFLVHDSGVERLILLTSVDESKCSKTTDFWKNSSPTYATSYYSDNDGVSALLQRAEWDSTLKTIS